MNRRLALTVAGLAVATGVMILPSPAQAAPKHLAAPSVGQAFQGHGVPRNAPSIDRYLYLRSPYMRGDDVQLIQFCVGAREDAIFGPATRRAVQRFQRNNGLVPDGVVGPFTAHACNYAFMGRRR